jgi:hypothetical protein
MKVIDGQYAGRYIFAGLNIQNQNPTAQEIGQSQLSAICHAIGLLQLQDSNELHNKPLEVKVSIRPARTDERTGQTYDADNDVKGFRALKTGGTAQTAAPAQPQPQAWTQPQPVATPQPQPVASAHAPAQPQASPDVPPWAQPPANG